MPAEAGQAKEGGIRSHRRHVISIEAVVTAYALATLVAVGLLVARMLPCRGWRIPHPADYDRHWYKRIIEARQTSCKIMGV